MLLLSKKHLEAQREYVREQMRKNPVKAKARQARLAAIMGNASMLRRPMCGMPTSSTPNKKA